MPDPTTAAYGLIALRAIAPTALAAVGKALGKSVDKVKLSLDSTFSQHLDQTFQKCSQVKTIFSDDAFIPLKSLYVNLNVSSKQKTIRDEDIVLNNDVGSVVICGTGGAGKTMLMKYITLMMLEDPKGKVPIFVELRNLPAHKQEDFYENIYKLLTRERDHKNFDIFIEGLRAGIFTILFDGLDEVKPDQKEQIFSSIQRIALDFPEVRVIASTRPEIDTRSWDTLRTFHVDGLSHEQAKLLISKISFDETLKQDFLNLLTKEFYGKHTTFLEVPLLCSLMLLTFNEYKEIPSRLTVFYDQAFETLFRKHDRLKEGHFKREFKSNLPSDRFRSIFSAFCYRTLAFNELSFSDEKFLTHIRRAAEDCEVTINPDDYAYDIVSNVCMIMRDGLDLHFIHRSFQEYFAAIYIIRYRGPDLFGVANKVLEGIIFNDVAKMAYDIEPQTFEREWVYPAIKQFADYLKRSPKIQRSYRFLKQTTHSIRFDGNPPNKFRVYSWRLDQKFRRWSSEMEKIYGEKWTVNKVFFSSYAPLSAECFCDPSFPQGAVPDKIRRMCSGEDVRDEDGDVTVAYTKITQEFIAATTAFEKLESAISEVIQFEAMLKRTIEKRDNISVLD